jgi:S-formylglutathione hydrolase FrmB
MRQTVQEIICSVSWLESMGYQKIGIMGGSIGSCASFLAAVHEPRIRGLFANHMSGYFGEVVWTGLSTRHIRKSLDGHVNLDEIRDYWRPNSPIAFIDQIGRWNPDLKIQIISAKYDTTFLYYLTLQMFQALDESGTSYVRRVLPAGHYSIGAYWFKYYVAYQLVKFFNRIRM